ncbi:MAG: siphovirus Gp157 family protein [Candidatus Acidiferrales bacterium]
MSLAIKHAPQLYAVVDRGAPAPLARETIAELREQKHGEIAAKQAIDRASAVLDTLEARRAAYKTQIAELRKRDEMAAARIDNIEDQVLTRMEHAKLTAAAGFHVTFSARPAPAALDVLDESLIPRDRDYFREKLTVAVDKNAIKRDLAAGAEIAGVRLTQKLTLLRK